jgi:hypothetical protein
MPETGKRYIVKRAGTQLIVVDSEHPDIKKLGLEDELPEESEGVIRLPLEVALVIAEHMSGTHFAKGETKLRESKETNLKVKCVESLVKIAEGCPDDDVEVKKHLANVIGQIARLEDGKL